MVVRPLTVEYAAEVAAGARAPDFARPEYVRDLIAAGPAFACLDGGRVFAILGVADHGGGRGHAWAYIADGARREAVAVSLTRAARRWLDGAPFRRIEAVSADGDEAYHTACARWAIRLGFMFEGPALSWLADGGDVLRWYRLRRA